MPCRRKGTKDPHSAAIASIETRCASLRDEGSGRGAAAARGRGDRTPHAFSERGHGQRQRLAGRRVVVVRDELARSRGRRRAVEAARRSPRSAARVPSPRRSPRARRRRRRSARGAPAARARPRHARPEGLPAPNSRTSSMSRPETRRARSSSGRRQARSDRETVVLTHLTTSCSIGAQAVHFARLQRGVVRAVDKIVRKLLDSGRVSRAARDVRSPFGRPCEGCRF